MRTPSSGGSVSRDELVLRPRAWHSGPLVALSALGVLACGWGAFGFAGVGNTQLVVTCAVVGVVITTALFLYFRNAALLANPKIVAKRDLLGRQTGCARAEFGSIVVRYVPQPAYYFLHTDGTTAFRVNGRLWADDQIVDLKTYLGAA